jgi:hypothetical protein
MPEILFGCDQVLDPIGKKNGYDHKVIDWTTEASSKDRHSKSINIFGCVVHDRECSINKR